MLIVVYDVNVLLNLLAAHLCNRQLSQTVSRLTKSSAFYTICTKNYDNIHFFAVTFRSPYLMQQKFISFSAKINVHITLPSISIFPICFPRASVRLFRKCFTFDQDNRCFSTPTCPTRVWDHPSSYSNTTVALSPAVRRGREGQPITPSSAGDKNV